MEIRTQLWRLNLQHTNDMYAPGVPSDVVVLTAPQLLGFLWNWALFGVLTAQVYYYSIHFKADRRGLKLLVYGLYIWEVVQTALIGRDAFAIFGRGWGDLSVLVSAETLWFNSPFMSGTISITVQSFFAWRIYVLRIIVKITLSGSDAGLQAKTYPVTTVWLVCSAACDLIICICMIVWYMRTRVHVTFRATDDIITQVIRLSVATGMLTAAVATVDTVMFLVFQNNNYHMCPAIILGKLYSNSLLALLNQRYRVDNGSSSRYLYDTDLSEQPSLQAVRARRGAGADNVHHVAVNIVQESESNGDSIPMATFAVRACYSYFLSYILRS
ncbi:hypothetical protein OF83DRAFT_404825 [Amylostereum chailletii]|nr:hypothetical protein OF83DRAFT_404825 [Amylostereum chailletii]